MRNFRNLDFKQFYIRTSISGNDYIVVRPGISLIFFLDEPLEVSCSAVADLIDLFFFTVPRATLRSYLAKNGYYKPLTDRQITKDLKMLRNLPADYQGYTLSYSEAEFGAAGAYAIDFKAMAPHPIAPDSSNLVRVAFPEDVLDSWGEPRFLQLITDAAQCLPFSSGYAGFAFHRSAFESESIAEIVRWLPRYLGFDPSEHLGMLWMKGHTYSSQWINLLGPQLTETLGGLETIEAGLAQAEVKPLRNGVWIRGARLPPVGDVNHGADDIGQLPNIARLLLRVRCPNLRFLYTESDAMEWLARYDELPARGWDNS
jgi:hypothetical protein